MDKKLVSRTIFSKILNHLDEKEITVIIGPRQVGKTTLIFQLKEELIKKKKISSQNIYYFNLDLFSDFELFRDQNNLIYFIKNRILPNQKLYLFVDEVQRLENAGLFFKGIYDLQLPIKILLSGSSSLEIKAKTIEPLTGRKRIFRLYPLSFSEYLSFLGEEKFMILKNKKDDPYLRQKILPYLFNFILFGGYPKVVTEENLEKKVIHLEEIFTSYIEKDIAGFLKIKDPFIFSKLVKILAQEIGNLVNIEGLSKELGIKNETIKNYLTILEETFILKRVYPFFKSTRTEIRKMPKVYFLDTGMRNFSVYFRNLSEINFYNLKEKGSLLESYIFNELIKSEWPINFWRTKDGAEVDFIITKKNKIIPIEIKTTIDKNLSISRGFISFIKKYQPEQGLVFNLEKTGKRKVNNTLVDYCLPYYLDCFL